MVLSMMLNCIALLPKNCLLSRAFAIKAMESMQELNPNKERASNSQIMFLCLHAAGLTLIPTSIIGYRAAMNASNPADVMLPMIITSFAGTLAALRRGFVPLQAGRAEPGHGGPVRRRQGPGYAGLGVRSAA